MADDADAAMVAPDQSVDPPLDQFCTEIGVDISKVQKRATTVDDVRQIVMAYGYDLDKVETKFELKTAEAAKLVNYFKPKTVPKTSQEDQKRSEQVSFTGADDLNRLFSKLGVIDESIASVRQEVAASRQEVAAVKRLAESGLFSSIILIQTPIPDKLLQSGSSIAASRVGQDADITDFIANQVLGHVNDEWKVDGVPDSVRHGIGSFRDFADQSQKFGFVEVENDNQYNIKVNIKDCNQKEIHLTARTDFLITPKVYAHKNQPHIDLFRQTVLFVEVISGGKTEDQSIQQLLTTLKAVSVHLGKASFLYGAVVDKNFTQGRLVKYHLECCYSDGMFHPSQLEAVCDLVLKRP